MGGEYSPILVVVSVVIAVFASYTALDLAGSVSSARGQGRARWLAGGSLALGIGIWSMHFVGMLAFHIPGHTITYELPLLLASVVVAIVASGVALVTVSRPTVTVTALIVGGLAMGVAIAGMHYTGMAALHMAAVIRWDGWIVAASIAIAVAASFVALWLALRFRADRTSRARWLKLGGGLVMGFAIAGMHYTGMAAATFLPDDRVMNTSSQYVVATGGLAASLTAATLLVLGIAIVSSVISREMARRSDLAEENQRLYAQSQRELAEKQSIEQRLRESEEYYRSLIENASDLIVVADEGGERRYASPSYGRVLGYDVERLIGTQAFREVHPQDIGPAAECFNGLLARGAGDTARFEARVRHADGSWRTLRLFMQNLLSNPAVRGVIITAHDETDRIKLEEEFRQAQKMEAIGRLAGGIAHDFNNLLTVIEGNVHFLAAEPDATPVIHEGLNEIRTASERAATLTRQLLAFSRRQILQPRILSLNDVVAGMLSMLRRLLGEDIEVRSELDGDLGLVRADPGQLEQVIMNLAVNARDSMPAGGTLTLSTSNTNRATSETSPHDEVPSGDYVMLSVSDTGAGIEPVTLERIFEPFFTTKEQGKGTGLGLATVYGIMKQSGGYVAVSSSPGAGATFRLLFPRVTAPEPANYVQKEDRGVLGGSETILLVEDEAPLRALAKRVLVKKGYAVIEAANGHEAVALCSHHNGPIHLLLTDVVLPGWNGREVADRISIMRPGIRVLFTSGYTEDEIIHRGVMRDGISFLEKPFTPDMLLSKVRGMLTAGPPAASFGSPALF